MIEEHLLNISPSQEMPSSFPANKVLNNSQQQFLECVTRFSQCFQGDDKYLPPLLQKHTIFGDHIFTSKSLLGNNNLLSNLANCQSSTFSYSQVPLSSRSLHSHQSSAGSLAQQVSSQSSSYLSQKGISSVNYNIDICHDTNASNAKDMFPFNTHLPPSQAGTSNTSINSGFLSSNHLREGKPLQLAQSLIKNEPCESGISKTNTQSSNHLCEGKPLQHSQSLIKNEPCESGISKTNTQSNIEIHKSSEVIAGPSSILQSSNLPLPVEIFPNTAHTSHAGPLSLETPTEDDWCLKCEQCGAKLDNAGNLKRHLETHGSGHKYQCSLCNCAYTNSASLVHHRLHVHNVYDDDRLFKCQFCEKSFKTKRWFNRHCNSEHAGQYQNTTKYSKYKEM